MMWRSNPDYDEKGNAISLYLMENVKGAAPLIVLKRTKNRPLAFPLIMNVIEQLEIFNQYQHLKIGPAKKELFKKSKEYKPPQFKENPPRILWNDKVIEFPADSIEHEVCKIAFSRTIGKEISWDEIAKNVDGLPKDKLKTGRQSVYDAVKRVNHKTKLLVNKELFRWTEKAFIRII